MYQHPSSSTMINRRTGRDVQREIVTGLQSLVLTDNVFLYRLIGMGGYAEVYEGSLFNPRVNMWTKVAVKRFRVILDKEKEFAEAFARELCIWAKLQHENVLRLIGMVVVEGTPALASEWMRNGTMNDYLKAHEDVDVLMLAQGIAYGLEYLHSVGVVHSDLKGDNVLMTDDGRPVLSDFGISRLLVNSRTFVGTTAIKGNMRWMAPELISIDNEESHHTKASDVWAFGMVLYEALSGNAPYHTVQNEAQVMMSIVSKRLPTKPEVGRERGRWFEVVWGCCCECWKQVPKDRPIMSTMRERLKGLLSVEYLSSALTGMAWMSPSGRFLAIRSDDQKSVSFLETSMMVRRGRGLRAESEINTVAWSNTTEDIVTFSRDGIIRKWSNIFEALVVVAQSAQKIHDARLEFSPDDRFIASFSNWTAKLFDASNLFHIWEYQGYWDCLAFHPLGNRLVFCGGSVIDVDIEDLENITTTSHRLKFSPGDLVFSPSGNTCLTKTLLGAAILSGESFEEIASLPYAYCEAAQFTPDGKYILLVLRSKNVVLWDIAAGEAVEKLSLSLGLKSVDYWWAKISKSCQVVQLDAYTGSKRAIRVLRLTSSYY